jgi:hypothetical protein
MRPQGLTLHPIRLTNAIEKEVGEMKLARFIGNGRLLILCGSQAQQEKIFKMEKLNGKKMKSHVPGVYARLRGVITGVPISMSTEYIKENVKRGRVIEAEKVDQ